MTLQSGACYTFGAVSRSGHSHYMIDQGWENGNLVSSLPHVLDQPMPSPPFLARNDWCDAQRMPVSAFQWWYGGVEAVVMVEEWSNHTGNVWIHFALSLSLSPWQHLYVNCIERRSGGQLIYSQERHEYPGLWNAAKGDLVAAPSDCTPYICRICSQLFVYPRRHSRWIPVHSAAYIVVPVYSLLISK